MPTMGKLFAAVLIGGLGYLAAGAVAGHLPPERPEGMLRIVAAFFGVIVGWRFLGKRAYGSMSTTVGVGLSAAAALVLVSLIWFSGYEMIRRAMRMAYGGNPFEAVQDMFQIAFEFVSDFLIFPDVIGILVIGGALCGWIVGAVSRRWS